MKKHTIVNKRTEADAKNKLFLDYSLILTDRTEEDLFENEGVYSVLILQIENGITTNYDFLYDVARDKENAVAILNLLVYNNVMPGNARDVLEDTL